jgi:hypothetical protein
LKRKYDFKIDINIYDSEGSIAFRIYINAYDNSGKAALSSGFIQIPVTPRKIQTSGLT